MSEGIISLSLGGVYLEWRKRIQPINRSFVYLPNKRDSIIQNRIILINIFFFFLSLSVLRRENQSFIFLMFRILLCYRSDVQ